MCVTPEGDQIENFEAPVNTPDANKMKCSEYLKISRF